MAKILNISEAASIAIHCMGIIANSKGQLNANRLIELTGFSKNHAAKVLQILVKMDYLKSTRGPKGGFVLTRSPEKISIMDIYEAIEGGIQDVHCHPGDADCPFEECIYGDLRENVDDTVKTYFANRKLSDVKIAKNLVL